MTEWWTLVYNKLNYTFAHFFLMWVFWFFKKFVRVLCMFWIKILHQIINVLWDIVFIFFPNGVFEEKFLISVHFSFSICSCWRKCCVCISWSDLLIKFRSYPSLLIFLSACSINCQEILKSSDLIWVLFLLLGYIFLSCVTQWI